jgi:hypothetical protein
LGAWGWVHGGCSECMGFATSRCSSCTAAHLDATYRLTTLTSKLLPTHLDATYGLKHKPAYLE